MQKLSEILDEPKKWTKKALIREIYDKHMVIEPDPRKWDHREYYVTAGKFLHHAFCLSGAIYTQTKAATPAQLKNGGCVNDVITDTERHLLQVMVDVIRDLYPSRIVSVKNCHPANSIIWFNDHADTTFEEIQRITEEYDRRVMLSGVNHAEAC